MTRSLPEAIQRYFSGKNSGDFDKATAAFTSNAVVVDERNTYSARRAIRTWLEETSRKYNDTTEIESVVLDGETVRVSGRVSGSFPGSPATLQFNFVLDGGLIGRLEIGT